MSKFELEFHLRDTEKIVIKLKENLGEVHCCYEALIVFLGDNIVSELSCESIRHNIGCLSYLLCKSLNKELTLHSSITLDIGLLWNKVLQHQRSGLFYINADQRKMWVGCQYILWETRGSMKSLTTWLYNDHDGSIIFEITPNYPWEFEGAEQDSNFIPYEEWIKSYKPFLIRKIPIEVARQWLDQATSVLNKIEENMARLTVEAREREKKEKEQLASSRDADEEKVRE
jgi:hypothetical protein